MNDPILTGSDVYDLLHNPIIAKIRPLQILWSNNKMNLTRMLNEITNAKAQNNSIRNGAKHIENAMIPQKDYSVI